MKGGVVVQVQPLPETSVDMSVERKHILKDHQYEEPWKSLINYDRTELKSAQELLYEVGFYFTSIS